MSDPITVADGVVIRRESLYFENSSEREVTAIWPAGGMPEDDIEAVSEEVANFVWAEEGVDLEQRGIEVVDND